MLQKWGIALPGLNILFVERIQETLYCLTRKEVEHFKHGLLGHLSIGMKDCEMESYVDCYRFNLGFKA